MFLRSPDNCYFMKGSARIEKIGFVLAIALIGGLVFVYGGFWGSEEPDAGPVEEQPGPEVDDNEENPDTYAEPNESVAHETDEDAEADVQIVISSTGVSPSRPKLSVGDVVGFKNELEDPVSIQIDRTDREINLESGESESLTFSGKTYYQVYLDGNIISRGSLNVE